jgi:hypothetical protein
MKKFMLIILGFLPAILLKAQVDRDTTENKGMGKMSVSEVLAKPVFETINGGYDQKVWIMTVVKGVRDIDLNTSNRDDDVNGTHTIVVVLKDEKSNKEVMGADVQLSYVTPSGKKGNVAMETTMNQYGANVNFDEKGEYQLSLSVKAGGESVSTPFSYTVK